MLKMKRPNFLFLLMIITSIYVSYANSQIVTASAPNLIGVRFIATKERGEQRLRGSAAGGYRCLQPVSRSPEAIVPLNSVVTTINSNPPLYIYLPKQDKARSAEFRIEDSDGENVLYESSLLTSGKEGVIKLNFPDTVVLESGKNYRWSFIVVCDEEGVSSNPFVNGIIRRVEPTDRLNLQLQQEIDPLKQAKLYAAASIWQEALDIMIEQRQQYPKEWQEFLRSVKLEKYNTTPFLDCCNAEDG